MMFKRNDNDNSRDQRDIDEIIEDIIDAADRNYRGVNLMAQFGTWFTYQKPEWEENLENTSDYVLDKTGMSRDKLKSVLEYLHEHGVIK
jgi:hypothetical protein